MLTENGYLLLFGSSLVCLTAIIFSISWAYLFSIAFIFLILIEAIRFRITSRALKNLEIKREVDEICYVDSILEVKLGIKNSKKIPYVILIDEIPRGFEHKAGNIAFKGTLEKGKTELKYYLVPKEIGLKEFKKIRIILFDPLFIFFKSLEMKVESKVACYPSYSYRYSMNILRSLTIASEIGSMSLRRRGEGLEFYSIREYAYGDDLKRIAWKHVAKSPERKLYIIEKEEEKKSDFRIILHLSRTFEEGLEGERKIDALAVTILQLVNLLIKQNTLVDIIILMNGSIQKFMIRRERDINELIEFFGMISIENDFGDLTLLEEFLSKNYHSGASFLFITDRSFDKFSLDLFKTISEKYIIEIVLLKTIPNKIIKDDIIMIYENLEEIILEKISNNLKKINLNSQIVNQEDLLFYLIKAYNKEKIYRSEIEYGKRIH